MNVKITKEMTDDPNHIQFGHMLASEKDESCYDQRVEYIYIYMCPISYELYMGNGYSPKEAIKNMNRINHNGYDNSVVSKLLCGLESFGVCEHNFTEED